MAFPGQGLQHPLHSSRTGGGSGALADPWPAGPASFRMEWAAHGWTDEGDGKTCHTDQQ